jgi:hypothetical protein
VVALPHIRPGQRADLRVQSGTLRLRIGATEEILNGGDERTVPAGTSHAWVNVGQGMPRNPLQASVWAFDFRREIALPSARAQALALPLVALLAAARRMIGDRSCYARYAEEG